MATLIELTQRGDTKVWLNADKIETMRVVNDGTYGQDETRILFATRSDSGGLLKVLETPAQIVRKVEQNREMAVTITEWPRGRLPIDG